MTTATPTQPALRRVPFRVLKAFPTLFEQYCTNYDALADFYAGDFRRDDVRRAAAEQVAAYDRDRDTLADVLLEQNERWGLDEQTRAHIEALRHPESVAVVTGQQVGLLAGSLYTPYKTITALQLARQLAQETSRPVVPVFWLEGEDHDLEEVAGLHLLRRNDLVRVRYRGHEPPASGNLGPVGRLVLTPQIHEVVAQVDEVLWPSDFKDDLMERIRHAYRPGATLLDAFARLLRAFFPDAGLVFINPDDARLKRLAAPLFQREIEDYEGVAARVWAVSDRLEEQYHAQVRANPTNLFLLDDSGRHAVDADRTAGVDRYLLRGKNKTFTREALLTLLDRSPERFSPNVILRPLVQDRLLPTAAYVAGPGEVSYFAQFKPVYEWAGIPMPVVYPRASVTLVESKVRKVLNRYELSLVDFKTDLEALFNRVVIEAMEVDVEEVFSAAARQVHEAVNGLKPEVERVDRSLVKSAEAMRAALVKELDKFKARVVRAEKRNQDEIRAQLEKACVNLFPGGSLQERTLSALFYLNKYGLGFLTHLHDELSPDTTEHQVIDI